MRLYGPAYEVLVKDFWKQADCDNLHIISHVLGVGSGVTASNKNFGNIYPGIYRVHKDWLLNCRSTIFSLMTLGINGFVNKILSTENKCKQK